MLFHASFFHAILALFIIIASAFLFLMLYDLGVVYDGITLIFDDCCLLTHTKKISIMHGKLGRTINAYKMHQTNKDR